MSVLCKCRVCSFEFAYSGFVSGDAEVFTQGCTTTCLKCGNEADILDGTYEINDSKLVGLSGPEITMQVANRLRAVAVRAREGDIEATELIAEIAGVSPELAAKISKHGFGIFGILMVLFWLIKSVQLNITVDVNKLFDQVLGNEKNYEILQFDEHTPIPEDVIISKPTSPTIAAGPKEASQNRKERRRQASLGKRRAKRNA